MQREILVANPGELREAAAGLFERLAAEAIAARGRFAVALPGGSSAEEYFPRLSRCAVDWRRTHFFWSDERAVPSGDPRSNFVLAERLWLRPALVPAENLHRLRGELQDGAQAAAQGEAELVLLLGTPPALDLVWLGVGEDGHVASLFPGHPLLAERARYVAPLSDSPKPPERRLTLTLPAIAAARDLLITASGAGKAAALARALGNAPSGLPLDEVLRLADRSWIFLDGAAAEGLASDLALRRVE